MIRLIEIKSKDKGLLYRIVSNVVKHEATK